MPVVTVHTWEDGLDEKISSQLIASVTDAVAQTLGEHTRSHTTVIVTGVPRSRWGAGGAQASTFGDDSSQEGS